MKFWQRAEQNRKTPWKLIGTFGLWPLLRYITGTLDLDAAFRGGGAKLGITARPVIMPMAEAAIDVDKPSDLELVQKIVRARVAGA